MCLDKSAADDNLLEIDPTKLFHLETPPDDLHTHA